MSFFSMEHTTVKTWLVANLKWWCVVPLWLFAGIVYLFVLVFKGGNQASVDYVLLCAGSGFLLSCALYAGFKTVKDHGSAIVVYSMLALLPIVGVGLLIAKIVSYPLFTAGVIVWLCISIVIGIYPALIIWRYSFKNFYTQLSDIDKRILSNTEYNEKRTAFAYGRSVEAYLISVMSFAAFGALFV